MLLSLLNAQRSTRTLTLTQPPSHARSPIPAALTDAAVEKVNPAFAARQRRRKGTVVKGKERAAGPTEKDGGGQRREGKGNGEEEDDYDFRRFEKPPTPWWNGFPDTDGEGLAGGSSLDPWKSNPVAVEPSLLGCIAEMFISDKPPPGAEKRGIAPRGPGRFVVSLTHL